MNTPEQEKNLEERVMELEEENEALRLQINRAKLLDRITAIITIARWGAEFVKDVMRAPP